MKVVSGGVLLGWVALLAVVVLGQGETCPPPGFDSAPDFNVTEYIAERWYIQKQIPVVYQPVDQLFCVTAIYEQKDPNDLSEGIFVYNYQNEGGVNGKAISTREDDGGLFSGPLTAIVDDPSDPSKLKVGLTGVTGRPVFPGPYWVVAFDPDYQWAIVVGGPPTETLENGCGYDGNGTNGNGFWLFSRKQVDPEGTAIMEAKAEELGLDTSVLIDVPQEGCLYEGA